MAVWHRKRLSSAEALSFFFIFSASSVDVLCRAAHGLLYVGNPKSASAWRIRKMTNRWQQVARIFESVVSRPAADRAALLDDACGDDSGLRREVESLLAEEHAPVLLDAPIAAAAHARLGD